MCDEAEREAWANRTRERHRVEEREYYRVHAPLLKWKCQQEVDALNDWQQSASYHLSMAGTVLNDQSLRDMACSFNERMELAREAFHSLPEEEKSERREQRKRLEEEARRSQRQANRHLEKLGQDAWLLVARGCQTRDEALMLLGAACLLDCLPMKQAGMKELARLL